MMKPMLFGIVLLSGITSGLQETYPANEYEYSLRRDYLLQKEREFLGDERNLTPDEEIVGRYLMYLKEQEFQQKKDAFPPIRPIQDVMDSIETSEVFRVLKTFPKGANSHSHENHDLSKTLLYNIIWNSVDIKYLWILPADHPTTPWKLDFFVNPPVGEGWLKVIDSPQYTKENITQNQHFIGIMSDDAKRYPSDSGLRWKEMNQLWERGSDQLINNKNIKEKYLVAMYENCLAEGVQYLETRQAFRQQDIIYELSDDPVYNVTYGKKYLDTTAEYDINMTLSILDQFIQDHPQFIGHRRIDCSIRFSDISSVWAYMQQALALHTKYPDHLVGFDIVAEEDFGHSHLFFLENFMKFYDPNTEESKMDFYLHTGETSWPGDLITSNFPEDPVASAQNTYDAILLGAKRVGHGLAYIDYPYLLQEMKNRGIAIEVCPVSNQLLGLQADLRNHPAQHYIKMGIPVLLGSDDKGTFGYDHFTTDWYEAFMSWGLTLWDMKQLSLNGINYSAMSTQDKQAAMDKWTLYWNDYIQNIKTEACNADLSQTPPNYYRLLPKKGAITGRTNVHVFGRHFESAVCSSVVCQFGSTEVAGSFVDTTHLLCPSPPGNGTRQELNLSISLDGALSFINTGMNFNYEYESISITEPIATTTPSGETCGGLRSSYNIIMIVGIFLLYQLSIL